MPLSGKGMLVTSMNIDPSDEQEFNRWYDKEHLAERVAIEGFLEARRYMAHAAEVKYLSTYTTETFEALNSPAYRHVLANQTDWSKRNISRFQNPGRVIARITASRGEGRGAALGLVRLRPAAEGKDALRDSLRSKLDPGSLDSIISMHLIESDPDLSKTLNDPDARNPGAADWYILIDGTDLDAVRSASERFRSVGEGVGPAIVSVGLYRLMWDIAKSDLNR